MGNKMYMMSLYGDAFLSLPLSLSPECPENLPK